MKTIIQPPHESARIPQGPLASENLAIYDIMDRNGNWACSIYSNGLLSESQYNAFINAANNPYALAWEWSCWRFIEKAEAKIYFRQMLPARLTQAAINGGALALLALGGITWAALTVLGSAIAIVGLVIVLGGREVMSRCKSLAAARRNRRNPPVRKEIRTVRELHYLRIK